MAMTTRAKIVLAGLAAAAVVGSYMLVDRYVGVGNISQGVSQSARSVFVQDIGQKAQGLEAELERTTDTGKYAQQLSSLFNTMYAMAPEEKKLTLARETFYGLSPERQAEVMTGFFGGMEEQQGYTVLSGVVAGMPYTTTSQLTVAGLNGLNNADLFRAMSVTAGKLGERFKDSVGERVGGIFKFQ